MALLQLQSTINRFLHVSCIVYLLDIFDTIDPNQPNPTQRLVPLLIV